MNPWKQVSDILPPDRFVAYAREILACHRCTLVLLAQIEAHIPRPNTLREAPLLAFVQHIETAARRPHAHAPTDVLGDPGELMALLRSAVQRHGLTWHDLDAALTDGGALIDGHVHTPTTGGPPQ